MIRILVTGQSNAVFRGDGGAFDIPASVTFWNNKNDLNDLSDLGDSFVHADRNSHPFVNGKNNMFAHAAKFIANATNQDVEVILVAKGGTRLEGWDGKESPMYKRIIAVLDESGSRKVDLVFWHQGEGDNAEGYIDYKSRWLNLLGNLESDEVIDSDTPVIVGELAPKSQENMHKVLHSLVDHRTDIAAIRTLKTFDGTHFDGSVADEAGKIYASRFLLNMPNITHNKHVSEYGNYCSASAFSEFVAPHDTDVKIPVRAQLGEYRFIQPEGCFKAPYSGDFKFMARGYAYGGKTRLKLLDENLGEITMLSYSGMKDDIKNNPIMSGWADLPLQKDEVVWLGINQRSGETKKITSSAASRLCKLSVQVLNKN